MDVAVEYVPPALETDSFSQMVREANDELDL